MFIVEYVTPARKLAAQTRASFTGAHTLAKILKRKGCRSISVSEVARDRAPNDATTGNEVYIL